MNVTRRLRDAIGARIVVRSAALADRVERARGRNPAQRGDFDAALDGARAELAAMHASVIELASLRVVGELRALRESLMAISDRLEDVEPMANR